MSHHHEKFKVTEYWQQKAYVNSEKYLELYRQSIDEPEKFWAEQARRLHWFKEWVEVKNTSFNKPIDIKWFSGGKLNACYNCVDRHLPENAERVAFYWEPDNPSEKNLTITYSDLHKRVQTWAKALSEQGVKKGDRVTIYLPMIPEAIYSVLACARIGAIHSVVFAGFSPDSLADRINDCESEFLITADEGLRGSKKIPLKKNADLAAKNCPNLKKMFVVKRTGEKVDWQTGRDFWYHEMCDSTTGDFPCVEMDAEDPLFI
ncbi:MAG: AMP-binding protein, partial [Bdellovibrionales bacterium]|nr:AMP-binding protein [Bdellovibrionales bacterium]